MRAWAHGLAGGLALLMIGIFWGSTVLVELNGSPEMIARVKTGILWGMGILIPALMVSGLSGFRLARGRREREIEEKKRRQKIIALNGLLVLLPSAIFLADRASSGVIDTLFLTVQAVELAAGAFNVMLLLRNFRSGLALRALS